MLALLILAGGLVLAGAIQVVRLGVYRRNARRIGYEGAHRFGGRDDRE